MEPFQEISTPGSTTERVKVSDIVRDQNAVSRFHGDYQFEDLRTDGPVSTEWQAQPETAGLRVQGSVHGALVLDCARCLEPYEVSVDLQIDEHYVFASYVDPYEKEKELSSEDFFEVVNEEGELDLKDLAHQFLVMEAENHSTCGRVECSFVQADS
jgi:uncharacterized metal-binding protein YceD (DUF177 family)